MLKSIRLSAESISDMSSNRVVPSATRSDFTLSSPEDDHWFEILFKDDVARARYLLLESTEKEKDRVLNGIIMTSFPPLNSCMMELFPRFLVTRSFHAAAALGSFGVLQLMIEHGVDVEQNDGESYNVIHSLIAMAYVDNTQETLYAHR